MIKALEQIREGVGPDGDFMIEIDEPSVESRYESHKMSFDWARQALSFISI